MYDKIEENRERYGVYHCQYFTPKDNKELREALKSGKVLPEGIEQCENNQKKFKRIVMPKTNDDIIEYLSYKQIELLTTIKNCIVYFTVCSIVGGVFLFWQSCAA